MSDDWGSFEIEGLAELDAKLAELDNATAGKALFSALNAGATPMVKAAKDKAAIAEATHKMQYGSGYVLVNPGLLKSSIKKKRLTKAEHAVAVEQGAAVGIYIGKGQGGLYPRYWHFLENGTSKMAAVPYLRPAFDENVNLAVEKFADKLKKNIDKLTS